MKASLAPILLALATFLLPGAAAAQSMQGNWQYTFKSVDGLNSGTMEIAANGTARASGQVSGIGYMETGKATLKGGAVDIIFANVAVPRSGFKYWPDHFVCRFRSADRLDCTVTDARDAEDEDSVLVLHPAYASQLTRAGSGDAAAPNQATRPADSDKFYVDRRSGCRLWPARFHTDVTLQWSGGCHNGLAEGSGIATLVHADASETGEVEVRIEGRYTNGWLNGRALITYKDGSRFEGEMKNGIKEGRGRLTVAGLGYYEGAFSNGQFGGHGIFVVDKSCNCPMAGARYDGEWVNGAMQGTGVYTKADGQRYEGRWGNNLPEGAGTYTWDREGKRYVGKWASGCALGPDGTLFSFRLDGGSCDAMRDYLRRFGR